MPLVEAIDALAAVLFPHLDREVAEAMPVVSATITHAEWHELELIYTIKPKSLSQLGMEAHWVLDGIDPERYDVVVHADAVADAAGDPARVRRSVPTGRSTSAGSPT